MWMLIEVLCLWRWTYIKGRCPVPGGITCWHMLLNIWQSVTASFVILHCNFDMLIVARNYTMHSIQLPVWVLIWGAVRTPETVTSQVPNHKYRTRCFLTCTAGAQTPEQLYLVLLLCLSALSVEVVRYEKCSPASPPGGLLKGSTFCHGEPPASIPFSTWASGLLLCFLFQP